MKERLGTMGIPILITLAGFLIAYQFVDPAPPQEFTITTGPTDGSYYSFGKQYEGLLARHDVTLDVQTSAGSIENLQRLKDGSAQAAFIQGGIVSKETGADLDFLGSLYFEPLWVFVRSESQSSRISDLRGRRIAVGPEGSGTRAIALQILQDNNIDDRSATLVPVTGNEGAAALVHGDIDAMFIVTSGKSPVIERLLRTQGVSLMSFDRAQGYARRHPFLSPVTLPEGAFDMAANIPEKTTQLLATSAMLVVRSDLHPALQTLLLQAAEQVHSGHGLFEAPGQFPSLRYGDLPASDDAKRFYKSGPPFLQRYLPFWAAVLIDRMKVMLVPLIALFVPLVKVMPPVYRWRVRARIYHHYRELNEIDQRLREANSTTAIRACVERLAEIDNAVRDIHVPLSYAEELYELRVHLKLVRSAAEAALKS